MVEMRVDLSCLNQMNLNFSAINKFSENINVEEEENDLCWLMRH